MTTGQLFTGDALFGTSFTGIANYGVALGAGGWVNFNTLPRQVADVNGDGRADIIGFGGAATYVSLGQPNGNVAPLITAITNYAVALGAGGWVNFNTLPRQVADVNGDGRADIIGFGGASTFVSLGQSNGTFGNPITASSFYSLNNGWVSFDQYPRQVADVNGDGRADIIGFGQVATVVSLGQANGTFGSPITAIPNYSIGAGGWVSFDKYPRQVADVNGDGRADIVGFGQDATYVSFGQSNGTFSLFLTAIDSYSVSNGWVSFDKYPRQVADINGDGRADIVGFGQDGTVVSLAKTTINYNDSLVGGNGNDTLRGLTGNDTIVGRNGNDLATGGTGADRFLFDTNTAFNTQIGIDTITDFTPGQDRIVLDKTTFKSLNILSFASVNTLAQGLTSNALIFYVRSSGSLYYNQNGAATGFGSGGLFAKMDGSPALAAYDFLLVN